MSINIQSTTDTPEAVTAAMGDLAEGKIVEAPAKAEAEADSDDAAVDPDLATDDEVADDENQKPDEDKKSKKKGGFKRRIDKLTARAATAERDAAYWREAALKTKPAELDGKPAPAKAADGKPTADKFETHEDYVEALADWKVDQKLSARDAKQRETDVRSEMEKKTSTHVERVKAFVAKHEDFTDLMEDVDDIPMSLTVQQVILDSENGPELMYALAKDRAEYERICKLPAIAAARELGRFESKLASPGSQETPGPKTTKAPKPISPVGTTSTAGSPKSIHDPNISQKEYEALRDKQEAKRRA